MPVRFATPYVQLWTSDRGSERITSPVNCLAFSPSTRYLASGHENGELVVWDTDSGRKLKTWVTEKAVTCITWHTGWNSLVIWGCLGGNAYMWNFWRNEPPVPVLFGSTGDIVDLDFDEASEYLAGAVGPEVHVAQILRKSERFATFLILPPPVKPHEKDPAQNNLVVRPNSVNFIHDGQGLVVSYVFHGIICWDVQAATKLWVINFTPKYQITGACAISPDERYILVPNMEQRLNLYSIVPDSPPVHTYHNQAHPSRNFPVNVGFLHQGMGIVSGNTRGNVAIWETRSGELLQTLPHDGNVARIVSAALWGRHGIISTAAWDEDTSSAYIIVWRADIDETYRSSSVRWAFLRLSETLVRRQISLANLQWLGADIFDGNRHPYLSLWLSLLFLVAGIYIGWLPIKYHTGSTVLYAWEFTKHMSTHFVVSLMSMMNTLSASLSHYLRSLWLQMKEMLRDALREFLRVEPGQEA